jgi:hypothetical protein
MWREEVCKAKAREHNRQCVWPPTPGFVPPYQNVIAITDSAKVKRMGQTEVTKQNIQQTERR